MNTLYFGDDSALAEAVLRAQGHGQHLSALRHNGEPLPENPDGRGVALLRFCEGAQGRGLQVQQPARDPPPSDRLGG